MRNFILLLIAFLGACATAQTTGKVIDATTGEAIPLANIQCSANAGQSQDLVSNTEGFFTISENVGDDALLTVSYLGYEPAQLTLGQLKAKQSLISLQPSTYQLDEVKVSQHPGAAAIMAEVKKNLNRNYTAKGTASENRIFLRESSSFLPKQLDVEIDKSTGFTKDALREFNKELGTFTSRFISSPPREYTDLLCNVYKSQNPGVPYKMDVVKATKLKDQSRSVSLDGLQENAAHLLLKHLDSTKYYRIKSGWFGSRDTISLRKDFHPGKAKKPGEASQAKSRLLSFAAQNSVLSTDFDFIHYPEIYEFTYEGSVYLKDGNFAYVLTFKPDRSKAKYAGKLYVSQTDFAILRLDYSLAEGKKGDGFNMKLLLGVKTAENRRAGTIIYTQKAEGDGYYLQYASRERGQYIYVNRPLKFIELAKEEKDVVSFDLKIETDIIERTEYLNLGRDEITMAEFDNAKESEFKYLPIKQYDPKIWKDYGAIEPLQEMKRYKIDEAP